MTELPISFSCPKFTRGNLVWTCGRDEEGKITSVFVCNENGVIEKKVDYLDNMSKVDEIATHLTNDGWIKLSRPTITYNFKTEG